MAGETQKLRVAFMGTPDFAAPALQHLIDHEEFEVVAVYSQPPRPKGRGRRSAPRPGRARRSSDRSCSRIDPDRFRTAESPTTDKGLGERFAPAAVRARRRTTHLAVVARCSVAGFPGPSSRMSRCD